MPTLTDVYKTPEIGFLGTEFGFKRSTIVKSKKRNTISYTSKHMVILSKDLYTVIHTNHDDTFLA